MCFFVADLRVQQPLFSVMHHERGKYFRIIAFPEKLFDEEMVEFVLFHVNLKFAQPLGLLSRRYDLIFKLLAEQAWVSFHE